MHDIFASVHEADQVLRMVSDDITTLRDVRRDEWRNARRAGTSRDREFIKWDENVSLVFQKLCDLRDSAQFFIDTHTPPAIAELYFRRIYRD
ncbi:hypothetical protein O197_21 [Edwardsiella phage eiAU-183]|uniref:Uncharacterized protein n=2 Tax=Eiauvirus eiAU TaxID=1982112 RepID=W0LM15_9CAUD|nr:hypothetical protein CH09_gp21 [Edwardsiella phage eiAU-183]YP_009613871.1 hypothetical protein FDI58_gp21 [Edwardsiella phage eiAU]AHG23437.1 hypothetical protein P858_21 [Edwardsiella phage eiAU]AHG23491.1 hypothetical protein O197_21 [Edwardsiella phage eiAU-183]